MNIVRKWFKRRKLLKEMPEGCLLESTTTLDGVDFDCGYGGGTCCEHCCHFPHSVECGDPREEELL